jgi:hypothetical protein
MIVPLRAAMRSFRRRILERSIVGSRLIFNVEGVPDCPLTLSLSPEGARGQQLNGSGCMRASVAIAVESKRNQE